MENIRIIKPPKNTRKMAKSFPNLSKAPYLSNNCPKYLPENTLPDLYMLSSHKERKRKREERKRGKEGREIKKTEK